MSPIRIAKILFQYSHYKTINSLSIKNARVMVERGYSLTAPIPPPVVMTDHSQDTTLAR
jgi:hypothetical protein